MSFLPSLQAPFHRGSLATPPIVVLVVRNPRALDDSPTWLMVECCTTERADEDNKRPWQATIVLHYERILAEGDLKRETTPCTFQGGYSRMSDEVSLTSTIIDAGAIFLDLHGLQGQRIGTYLMNRIVEWVKQWPQATVHTIKLLEGQAQGNNKERRNRFYEQFGIEFDYDDPATRATGRSRPMLAAGLRTVDTWKENITVHRLDDYLARVLRREAYASGELSHRDRAVKELIAEARAREKRPIRWALAVTAQRLWARLGPWLVVAGCLAFLAADYLLRRR